MKTLVIGLGNPILGDDGVGWKVAGQLTRLIDPGSSVEIDCAALGGLSLMERMLGYQRVIVIDSIDSREGPEGSIRIFPLAELANPYAGHSASAHDSSLITALAAARSLGVETPTRVDVVAIEARNVRDFSEHLSPQIAAAVPLAAKAVLELLAD